jgi:hypothetical protein
MLGGISRLTCEVPPMSPPNLGLQPTSAYEIVWRRRG